MSKNANLFKEAIADAKTLRKVAMANAKKSLEEAFEPKMQSMLNNKLAEMEELEETENVEEGTDVDDASDVGNDMSHNAKRGKHQNETASMEEELEGILRELGMNESDDLEESQEIEESEEDYGLNASNVNEEGSDETETSDDSEDTSSEIPSDDMEGGEDMGAPEDENVTELTVSGLTDIVKQAVQDAMNGGTGMGDDTDMSDAGMDGAPDMGGADQPGGSDEEVDLDELLAELDGDVNESDDLEESDETNENQDIEESEEMDESAKKGMFEKGRAKGKHSGVPKNQGKPGFQKAPTGKTKKMSESLKDAISETTKAWFKAKGKGSVGKPTKQGKPGFQKAPTGKTPKVSELAQQELNEAIKTINELKSTLKETNLLNAKLLYVNKLFKAKPLSESQKVKVVAAFDKARNIQEAKVIFESLSETITVKKSPLKESLMTGMASKSISGVRPKQVIVEDAAVKRMQKLAGII